MRQVQIYFQNRRIKGRSMDRSLWVQFLGTQICVLVLTIGLQSER